VAATSPTLLLFALAACAADPRVFTPADDAAVRAVLHTQQDAWNRGDLEAFMVGYARTPDLVFTSGGNIRRGWQDTYDKYRARYGGDHAGMGHLDFEVLGVQPLGADGAIVLGRWRLTETPNAGGGVFSLGFARTDAGWRIVHDHTSLDSGSSSHHEG
jgi:ketosteroid isomerase-like protein